jgi:dTDP-4-dehydrorhamnose 3,5-epimerase
MKPTKKTKGSVMSKISHSDRIKDVFIVDLVAYADERGRFLETFRREWFPQRSWEKVQTNRSDSKAQVLRGLHYHHQQVDYWYVAAGEVQVGLCDLRADSPTYKQYQMLHLGGDNQKGVFIPIGVAHGFVALTDATLTYLVDNYYTGGDEFGVLWNDPDLGLPWAIETPILSERDQQNPRLKDIPPADLPS